MMTRNIKKMFVVLLSGVFAATSSQILYGFQDSGGAPAANTGTPTEGAPLSAAELQSLGGAYRFISGCARGPNPHGVDVS